MIGRLNTLTVSPFQERACDAAENDIIKTLNIISYGFKVIFFDFSSISENKLHINFVCPIAKFLAQNYLQV